MLFSNSIFRGLGFGAGDPLDPAVLTQGRARNIFAGLGDKIAIGIFKASASAFMTVRLLHRLEAVVYVRQAA